MGVELVLGFKNGTAGWADCFGPVFPHKCARVEYFAALAIENVIEAILVRPKHQLLWRAGTLAIDQDWNLSRIPIVLVVRRKLKVPLAPPGLSVQRDYAIGVQIVALTHSSIIVRGRIPDSPINRVEPWIERAGQPSCGASFLPRVALPRIVARLSRSWNRIEFPAKLARLGIVGGDKSSNAVRRNAIIAQIS